MGPQADLSEAEEACASGELSLARRDFENAERDFLAAVALAGGGGGDGGLWGRAHVGLGRVRLAAGDVEEAAAEFRRAHESRPEESGPLHWLGCAAAHQGAYASADEYFTSALACARPHRRSRVQRAYARVRLRRYEDALGDLRAASEEGGLDADARWVMAALSGEGGEGGEPAQGCEPAQGVEGGEPGQGGAVGDRGRLALLLRMAALGALAESGEVVDAVSGGGDADGGGGRGRGRGRGRDSGGCVGGRVGVPRSARLIDASLALAGSVEREFVPLYAVVLVLGGRREAAVALLEGAARNHPADHRITHTLALALLNSFGEPGGVEAADAEAADDPFRRWERCVAAWGALLHDDAFWEHRRAAAGARFGVPVEAALDPGLRADLRGLLERRMPAGDAGGRVPPGALLQREADAARLLAEVGGFPARRGESPLVGGPLRVAGLGMVDEFGSFAAGAGTGERTGTSVGVGAGAITTSAAVGGQAAQATASGADLDVDAGTGAGTRTGASTDTAASSPLAHAFSELGFAQLLLKQGRPADALAALAELRCRACRARRSGAKDGAGPTSVAAAICEPGCGRFDELNPAYAAHPDKHQRLARDARGLALRARLDAGRAELTAQRPAFAAAAASWRRALVHGRELDRYRETQAAVVDLALGAARAAHRAGDPTRAVDTLEAVRAITGANERGRLEGQLARLLADRGISAVNRDGTLLDAPAADLRRSVAFNPHLLRAQVSLGVVLRSLAARRWRSGSVSGARAALREALDRLGAALVHFPGDPELTEQRDAALADLDHVVAERQESGR